MLPPQHSTGHDQMLQFPAAPTPLPIDRRWKPNIEQAPNCPRCASSNTKFCYYNNYSLSQPRYFCKACRRYWTKGGSLRNVPIGGGTRKSRRGKAIRHPQNYTRIFAGNSGSKDKESAVADKPNHGSCEIDMALVFAKFLNQNHASPQELDNGSSSSNLSNSLKPESVESTKNDVILVESQKQFDHHPMTITAELVRRQDETRIQTFVGDELSRIEVQGLLDVAGGDEVAQDVFWSDHATTSSLVNWPSPMLQVQDLDYSLPFHDYDAGLQLPLTSSSSFSINQVTDSWSWSSFDLSTLEVFSRP